MTPSPAPPPPSTGTLAPSDLAALVRGEHANPFAVLGPHPIERDGRAAVVVRLLAPHAAAVRLRVGRRRVEAVRIHELGVHEALLEPAADVPLDPATGRPRYRVEIEEPDGTTRALDDPYRFGPVLAEEELARLSGGHHFAVGDLLGAHLVTHQKVRGVRFAVWAPNARRVSLVGGFNRWNGMAHPMRPRGSSGVWELFVPGLGAGELYKFEILPRTGPPFMKTDPAGGFTEVRPGTASIVIADVHVRARRVARSRRDLAVAARSPLERPISIYEVHVGSWRRESDPISPHGRWLTWNELADRLVPYAAGMGFTHIELMPITEHPFDGSWGYQSTGYFAPTSRHGTPREFARFVEAARAAGLGVILDWVPAHFPRDAAGLALFDGTELYEHADPRRGAHPDWGTLVFNWSRHEVSDFLISSGLHWLDRYGLDGLRVDAVASMLYLDYSRKEGEWIPNEYGGRENLRAIDFLKRFNELCHFHHPGVLTIAEESTAWPGVSRPTYVGGLGFSLKWNMGWMNDTLEYFTKDPIYRKYHHRNLTFSMLYAFTENFVLPLSHDEVVHGKCSLLDKMPGDGWQKFANLRLLLGFQYAMPGKKLLFMGSEFGQGIEWNCNQSLDWHLLDVEYHRGVQRFVRDVNHVYRAEPALYQIDFDWRGFEWVDFHDWEQSVASFLRRGEKPGEEVLVVVNFTPTPRFDYRIGVTAPGYYREILNSDSQYYGGSNLGNSGGVPSEDTPSHGRPWSISINLPPLAILFLKRS